VSAADALAFADELARACAPAAAGVVLHGSLRLGDYLPGSSDVDLLVVLGGRAPDVVAGVAAAQAPCCVDVRVVEREVAAAPTPSPPMAAYVRLDPRRRDVEVESSDGERDLVVELSVCRAHGRSLAGPPADELIGPVPDEWVLDVGDAQLADWQAIGDDPAYAQLTVLTACRVWRFAVERRHSSKTAAAEWALDRDPALTVVRDALRQRADPAAPIDPAGVAELLAVVRERVAAVR